MRLDLDEVGDGDEAIAVGVGSLSRGTGELGLVQHMGLHGQHIGNGDVAVAVDIAGDHHSPLVHDLAVGHQLDDHAGGSLAAEYDGAVLVDHTDAAALDAAEQLLHGNALDNTADGILTDGEQVGGDAGGGCGGQLAAGVGDRVGLAAAMVALGGLGAVLFGGGIVVADIQLVKLWPVAAIACCATSTVLQTEQCLPSVRPLEAQVAATA